MNRFIWIIGILLVGAVVTLSLLRQNPIEAQTEPPQKSIPLTAAVNSQTLTVSDSGGAQPFGKTRFVPLQGSGQAVEIRTLRPAANPWDLQLQTPLLAPIAEGDICLLQFRLRAVSSSAETGEAKAMVYVQKNQPDWEKAFSVVASAGSTWRDFSFPFTSPGAFAAGQTSLCIGAGFRPQAFEIAGLTLANYGKSVSLAELPRSRNTYRGIEPDAPWRREAQQRIERIRKVDVTVAVVDTTGNPVSGASVRLRMTRSAFAWGTAVRCDPLIDGKEENEPYRKTIVELFNRATPENELKWPAVAGDWGAYRQESVIASLRWLQQKGLSIRGHCMVWPGWTNLPNEAKNLRNDPDALRQLVLRHIDRMALMTSAYVSEWDVLNEPFNNDDVTKLLGPQSLGLWFREARAKLPPGCRLYLNDFGILETAGEASTPRQQFDERLIETLLAEKAPIEGVGLESHFGWDVTPPEQVLAILDRFARFGLPLEITEFTHDVTDEDFQAAYMRDFLTAAFSHPAVTGFVLWGFWEGNQFQPDAALFRRNWAPKPNGQAFMSLVRDQWRTDATGASNAAGMFSTRAFLGDYVVEATANGRTASTRSVVQSGANSIRIVIGL